MASVTIHPAISDTSRCIGCWAASETRITDPAVVGDGIHKGGKSAKLLRHGCRVCSSEKMIQQNLSSFIWSVADLLRGDYKQSE
ncbi:hypothetical protein [Novipirellula aureliae]|nr:hypothetical protein [Novipirellula aureliae]